MQHIHTMYVYFVVVRVGEKKKTIVKKGASRIFFFFFHKNMVSLYGGAAHGNVNALHYIRTPYYDVVAHVLYTCSRCSDGFRTAGCVRRSIAYYRLRERARCWTTGNGPQPLEERPKSARRRNVIRDRASRIPPCQSRGHVVVGENADSRASGPLQRAVRRRGAHRPARMISRRARCALEIRIIFSASRAIMLRDII